ncbi:MAG: type II toxin-antitoxin system RelE/ParE family toxin [Bacteroidetes bacterium]|jgi:plasmid stabilization system protein ParE|nr:type II toxin-antitoxin system RelE/ParE family toxin [Bacteroidota bacterium]
MTKAVILTPRAEKNYEHITDYVFNKWGTLATKRFILRFQEACNLIASRPAIYPFADKNKNVRKCVVTKHNAVYFIEHENDITILTIFDTRQNPDKLDMIF